MTIPAYPLKWPEGWKRTAPGDQWWDVLDVDPGADPVDVRAAYQRLRSLHHPDRPGGDAEAFRRVQDAWSSYERSTG